MNAKPSDIRIPSELTTEESAEAYCERLCILSNGDPLSLEMKAIALKEALEVERVTKGLLF